MAEETPQRKHLAIEHTNGQNSRDIDAYIQENGDLYIYGYDCARLPRIFSAAATTNTI